MIRTLIFLVFLALVASGFALIADLDGGLNITLGPYQMDVSVLGGMIGLVLTCTVILLVWSVIKFLWQIPQRFNAMLLARKQHKGQEALTKGLIAIGTGDMKAAEYCAKEAERLLGQTPLSLLLNAQAAQLNGNRDRADQHFRAMLAVPETRPLGLRGLFVEATRRGDADEAHHFAQEAYHLDPANTWSNEALVHWHAGRNEWEPARLVLKKAEHRGEAADQHRRMAVLLTAEALSHASQDSKLALSLANTALDKIPDFTPAALLAAKLLVKNNDVRKASRLLEKTYALYPHPDLADAYVHVRHGDSALERLSRAETLAKLAPDHEDSLYCLAKAELEAHHFDRVRTLLAEILADKPRTRFCLLMARLEALEHGDPSAQRDWLLRASRAPRDAAWIADGVISDQWQPLSPINGRLDAFKWHYPQEALTHTSAPQDMIEAFAEDPLARPKAPSTQEKNIQNLAKKAFANEVLHGRDMKPDLPSTATSNSAKMPVIGDVVFPLASSPDDPGPSGLDVESDDLDRMSKKEQFFVRS